MYTVHIKSLHTPGVNIKLGGTIHTVIHTQQTMWQNVLWPDQMYDVLGITLKRLVQV